MLMALFGLAYGMQMTSHTGLPSSIREGEEAAACAIQLLVESLGSLSGPPITSKIFYNYTSILQSSLLLSRAVNFQKCGFVLT